MGDSSDLGQVLTNLFKTELIEVDRVDKKVPG